MTKLRTVSVCRAWLFVSFGIFVPYFLILVNVGLVVCSAFFVTVRASTAYRKICGLDNNFFARIIRLTVQKFQLF